MKYIINKKVLLLFIAVILFFIVLFIDFNYYKNLYISSNYIDISEVEKITEGREEYGDIINLYYKDNVIPYNIDENYYLFHVANSEEYKKIYSDNTFSANIINQEDDNTIHLIIYNDNYYKITKIKLTNIPVISINTNETIEEKMYGDIYLYSSNETLNTTNIINYNCEFHIRGVSSQGAQKKSYKINLLTSKGKKLEISMLGMDSDDDWILNPLFSDESYIREKIGYDIWNSLSDEFNHTLEYVELIIDNSYQGIYCLQEAVDLDILAADKNNDFFISIKKYPDNIENSVLFDDSYTEESEIIDEFEMEEGLENNYSLRRNLLRAFMNKKNGIAENSIEYDLKNNANYTVFINLILAPDNIFINQKILFRNMENYYLIQKTPWDLDFSMLNKIMAQSVKYIWDINVILCDVTLSTEYTESYEFMQYQKEQYFKIRETIYNEETLNNMIDSYCNYLKQSGAVERNCAKWGNNNFEEECQVLKNFFKERIAVLDDYYGGL